MRVIVVTSQYPFGDWQEVFIEPELRALTRVFDEVIILPVRQRPNRRRALDGVRVLDPLSSSRGFTLLQLLHPLTWRHLFSSLGECARSVGLNPLRIRNCLTWSCYRSALERHAPLRALLRSRESQVLYCYWGATTAIIVPAAKALGVATCARYHAGDLYAEHPANNGFLAWRKEILASTDLSIFVSDHGRDYFLANVPNPANRPTKVSRLGSPDFGPPRPRATGRRADAPLLIVSVSRIDVEKRVHLIARLLKELARTRAVVWHHFGGGNSAELDSEIAGAGAQLQVRMEGVVSHEVLKRFYRENIIDLFINLSSFEGVPVSIMEALSANIPVLATNAGGSAEIVIDGRSGMVVDVEGCYDAGALARQILEALQPGGRIAVSRPREMWEEFCNGEKNASYLARDLIDLVRR